MTDERSAHLTMVAYNLQANSQKMETTESHKKLHTALVMPPETDENKDGDHSEQIQNNDRYSHIMFTRINERRNFFLLFMVALCK